MGLRAGSGASAPVSSLADLLHLLKLVDAHRLSGLHVALAHRRLRHRVPRERVDELLVVNVSVAIVVARRDQPTERRIVDADAVAAGLSIMECDEDGCRELNGRVEPTIDQLVEPDQEVFAAMFSYGDLDDDDDLAAPLGLGDDDNFV